jgi:hypothetical protein
MCVLEEKERDFYMDNAAMHKTLRDLIQDRIQLNDPPEIRQTFERLVLSGYSREQALDKLRAVAAEEVWDTLYRRGSVSSNEFEKLIKRLE